MITFKVFLEVLGCEGCGAVAHVGSWNHSMFKAHCFKFLMTSRVSWVFKCFWHSAVTNPLEASTMMQPPVNPGALALPRLVRVIPWVVLTKWSTKMVWPGNSLSCLSTGVWSVTQVLLGLDLVPLAVCFPN